MKEALREFVLVLTHMPNFSDELVVQFIRYCFSGIAASGISFHSNEN